MHTPSTMPLYGSEPDEPGLYLGLFHGRNDPDDQMIEWGFNGPLIGPLSFVRTTYTNVIKLGFHNAAAEKRYFPTQDMPHVDDQRRHGVLPRLLLRRLDGVLRHRLRHPRTRRHLQAVAPPRAHAVCAPAHIAPRSIQGILPTNKKAAMPATSKAASPAPTNWTRRQTLAALHIYFQLPFGQLHRGQPKIKQIAQWIGRTPSSVALKLVNLASLDPQIVASGRKGMANASTQDKAIWQEPQGNWDAVALEAAAEYETLATSHGLPANVDVIDELHDTLDIPEGKTRTATVEVRVNQARFRKAILASYNATCCISGLQHEKLLIASHIVP
jgi:hypothetical protein